MKNNLLFILGLLLSIPQFALSAELDSASQEALQKTQELLTNPALRNQAIEKDGKAKSADKMVEQLGGDAAAKEDIYKLAGDVFAELVKETKGDAKKMQEILSEVSRNPASFKDRWTPEQRARLKAIADQLEPHNKPK